MISGTCKKKRKKNPPPYGPSNFFAFLSFKSSSFGFFYFFRNQANSNNGGSNRTRSYYVILLNARVVLPIECTSFSFLFFSNTSDGQTMREKKCTFFSPYYTYVSCFFLRVLPTLFLFTEHISGERRNTHTRKPFFFRGGGRVHFFRQFLFFSFTRFQFRYYNETRISSYERFGITRRGCTSVFV